jgi:Cdc6-like AAA superfamily ATPase
MIEQNDVLSSIQRTFINFSLRAEKYSDDMLVDTFVDSAPMLDLLSNANSQIVYGRRGTGKTHALKYVSDLVRTRGETSVYLDLRSIGSNTSIYNDYSRPLSERAAQLINDVLQGILSAFYPIAVSALEHATHPEEITVRLDDFQSAISSVQIRGQSEAEISNASAQSDQTKSAISMDLSKTPAMHVSAGTD